MTYRTSFARRMLCIAVMATASVHAAGLFATEAAPAASATADDPSLPDQAVLRSTTNGSYTARLVFQPQRMVYRVELYHGGELWRGTETDVVKEAETTYQAFAQQTADLAQVEIDAMRLSAGKRYAEHMVQMNDQRLQGLRDDLERERQQSRQVLAQQNQTKQQAQALSSDLRSVSARLDQVQQDIRRLEKMKANPSLPLPSDTASPTPAPAAETPAAGDKP